MTDIDKYNLVCGLYKKTFSYGLPNSQNRWHTHHIKPKSIYPELADDYNNLVKVPDVVHWALHEWLNEHLKSTGNPAYDRLKHSDVASYINNSSKYKIDFSQRDAILDFIFARVRDYVVSLKTNEENCKRECEELDSVLSRAFVFCGAGVEFLPTLRMPDSLSAYIASTCKERADVYKYGYRLKRFVWSDLPSLLENIAANGFDAVRTSAGKIAAKHGIEGIAFKDLHKPYRHRPDKKVLYEMFFAVYARFKADGIPEIDASDFEDLILKAEVDIL